MSDHQLRLTSWSGWKNIYASVTVSVSGFYQEGNLSLLFVNTDEVQRKYSNWFILCWLAELDLSLLMQLTYVYFCSSWSPVVQSCSQRSFLMLKCQKLLLSPIHCTVCDHREFPLGSCPTLLLAPFSLYFFLCATVALGSALVSLHPRATVQLLEPQPVMDNPTRSPGIQWDTVHMRDYLCIALLSAVRYTLLAPRPIIWSPSYRLAPPQTGDWGSYSILNTWSLKTHKQQPDFQPARWEGLKRPIFTLPSGTSKSRAPDVNLIKYVRHCRIQYIFKYSKKDFLMTFQSLKPLCVSTLIPVHLARVLSFCLNGDTSERKALLKLTLTCCSLLFMNFE